MENHIEEFYDVIIIGAGAAGLICAISAGKRGRKVLLVEHNSNVGNKIRISGGGKCNFTNLNISNNNYLSNNSYFSISALKTYTNNDFISLVEKHHIKYHEKTLGQLFCDGSSQQIISMLLKECEEANVTISLNMSVASVEKIADDFVVESSKGSVKCHSLVIATGALSIPKMGSTDFGYKIARQFGLNIIHPKAALVALKFNQNLLEKTKHLSGISVAAQVSCNKQSFKEALLFTHKGISGPAILQISSYWNDGDEIVINMSPDIDILNELKKARDNSPRQEIATILSQIIPKKLAHYICAENNCSRIIAEINNKKLQQIADNIHNWRIIPEETEGFAKAEVTKGGVNTDEISAKSFESKKVPNLYFIGEVLDVTGHLGGYNFQWAWSSGYCAGQYV